MKDYKRLTERNENGEAIINMQGVTNEQEARKRIHEFSKLIINKLCVYEEKEESGELCDREELIEHLMTAKDTSTLIDKEIEFFIKHNEKVRKETAKEILQELYNRLELVSEDGACTMMLCNTHIFDLAKQFNVELEDEE